MLTGKSQLPKGCSPALIPTRQDTRQSANAVQQLADEGGAAPAEDSTH